MRYLILWLLLSVITQSHAEERTSFLSPDGRYEIFVFKELGDDFSFAGIRDRKTGKVFDTDAVDFGKSLSVEWRHDSRFVALCFSAGRFTTSSSLYSVNDTEITKIELPDFVLNIAGLQGAIKARLKNREISFIGFSSDDQCTLYAHIEPEFAELVKRTSLFDDKFHPTEITDFDVTLRLDGVSPAELVAVKAHRELSATAPLTSLSH